MRRWQWVLLSVSLLVYFVLFLRAIGPETRVWEQEGLGLTRDSQVLRLRPIEIVRYYASYQGDFYCYFEAGMRFAGIPLPGLDSMLGKRFARAKDRTIESQNPLLPYRDFDSVYPPAAVQYFRILSLVKSDAEGFFQGLRWVHLVAMGATIGLGYLVVGGNGWAYLFGALLWMVAMGPRILCMFDILPALLVMIAVYGAKRTWWWMTGVALALGVLIKIYPSFLIPLFLVYGWRRASWKGVMQVSCWGVAGTCVVLWPWIPGELGSVLKGVMMQASRQYLEYGSLMGSFLVQLRMLGLTEFRYDSELDSIAVISPMSHVLARLSTVLMGGLSLAVTWWYWKRSGERKLELLEGERFFHYGCLGVVLGLLLGSLVFSPQYEVWLFGVLLLVVRGGVSMWLWALFFCVIQIQHPILEGLGDQAKEVGRVAVFGIRNGVFVWMVWQWWKGEQTGHLGSRPQEENR